MTLDEAINHINQHRDEIPPAIALHVGFVMGRAKMMQESLAETVTALNAVRARDRGMDWWSGNTCRRADEALAKAQKVASSNDNG